MYTDNANYYLSETLNFTISKALVTIVALHEYTFEYNGQVRVADIYCDVEQQSSLPIDSCHINIRVVGDRVLRDVGEYDIELYLSECTNYRAEIATAHVNIVPKYIAIDINGNADKVYDGAKLYAYELEFLFDNIAGDTDIAISNSAGEEIDYILDAGQYRVTATHSNANYSGGASLNVSVYKAQREISVFIAPVYGGVKVISDTDGKIVFSVDGVVWIDLPDDNIIPLELNAEYKLNLMLQEDVNYLASEALIATAKMTPEILNEYISQLLYAEYSEENATLYNKILEIDCLFEEQRNQDYINNLTKLRSLYSNSLPKVVI
ncbi:MAG: hypothetical protein K2I79_01595, partial [Clostridia bacterium]|nr:hypothetical protein [Clostridia bacterium]